jgi:hypothetical protein
VPNRAKMAAIFLMICGKAYCILIGTATALKSISIPPPYPKQTSSLLSAPSWPPNCRRRRPNYDCTDLCPTLYAALIIHCVDCSVAESNFCVIFPIFLRYTTNFRGTLAAVPILTHPILQCLPTIPLL